MKVKEQRVAEKQKRGGVRSQGALAEMGIFHFPQQNTTKYINKKPTTKIHPPIPRAAPLLT
jgi:hypothetical protein